MKRFLFSSAVAALASLSIIAGQRQSPQVETGTCYYGIGGVDLPGIYVPPSVASYWGSDALQVCQNIAASGYGVSETYCSDSGGCVSLQ